VIDVNRHLSDWLGQRRNDRGAGGTERQKKRTACLDVTQAARQEYIRGPLLEKIETLLRQELANRNYPQTVGPWSLMPTIQIAIACFSGIPLSLPQEKTTSATQSRSNRTRNPRMTLILQ